MGKSVARLDMNTVIARCSNGERTVLVKYKPSRYDVLLIVPRRMEHTSMFCYALSRDYIVWREQKHVSESRALCLFPFPYSNALHIPVLASKIS